MPGIFLMHIRSQPSKTQNNLQTYERSGEPNSTSSPKTTVTTISSAMIDNVKQHSEWFPCVESHYCRASTQRQYHDPSRLVPTMHSLYVDSIFADSLQPRIPQAWSQLRGFDIMFQIISVIKHANYWGYHTFVYSNWMHPGNSFIFYCMLYLMR